MTMTHTKYNSYKLLDKQSKVLESEEDIEFPDDLCKICINTSL
jgi:hypothetical protein